MEGLPLLEKPLIIEPYDSEVASPEYSLAYLVTVAYFLLCRFSSHNLFLYFLFFSSSLYYPLLVKMMPLAAGPESFQKGELFGK